MDERGRVVVHGELVEASDGFTLYELARVCRVRHERIIALIEEGILEPEGSDPSLWRFPADSVRRARVVLRLQGDLGLDPTGAALVMELRDEIRRLRVLLERSAED